MGRLALALIAGPAGERQVRDPIRAALGAWNDVLDLQRHVRRAAIGTAPVPLLQQVFTDFVTGQFALLVLHTGDLRILERLGIETHQFLTEGGDWSEPAQPRHPVERRVEPML
jgi:hypothetical protein